MIKSTKKQIIEVIRLIDGLKRKLKNILDVLEKIAPELD